MRTINTTLTERRVRDRVAMCDRLIEIAQRHGAQVVAEESGRRIDIRINAVGGLAVHIDLSGESVQPDVHVIPWCIRFNSDARLAPSFGQVNPHHFAKATHVAYGWEQLAAEIERGLAAAADGTAFQP